jgi:hypothetical protein
MKKFEHLGRSLSKIDQKKILGGVGDGATCTYTYTGRTGQAHIVLVITMLYVLAGWIATFVGSHV